MSVCAHEVRTTIMPLSQMRKLRHTANKGRAGTRTQTCFLFSVFSGNGSSLPERALWPTVMLTDSCQTAPSPEISLILLDICNSPGSDLHTEINGFSIP